MPSLYQPVAYPLPIRAYCLASVDSASVLSCHTAAAVCLTAASYSDMADRSEPVAGPAIAADPAYPAAVPASVVEAVPAVAAVSVSEAVPALIPVFFPAFLAAVPAVFVPVLRAVLPFR